MENKAIQKEIRKRWKLAKGVMTDKASALANMAFSLGSLFGPIIGGKLYDSYGYRKTSDIICICALSAAVINFVIVFVPDLFKKKKPIEEANEDEDEDAVEVKNV